MTVIIIIFLIAIVSLFGMLMFRAWEIRTSRVEKPIIDGVRMPKIYFRHVEKIMLYLAKHIIQWIVLVTVKYYFILSTKAKKWICKNLPKISGFFKEKAESISRYENPFIHRAILESKVKIKRIKERVKKEHGDQNTTV
jgi:hypothetical protein